MWQHHSSLMFDENCLESGVSIFSIFGTNAQMLMFKFQVNRNLCSALGNFDSSNKTNVDHCVLCKENTYKHKSSLICVNGLNSSMTDKLILPSYK